MRIDHEKCTITFEKPTKVQMAFVLYFVWLHEVQSEICKNPHPSWKGYTKDVFSKIRAIKATMSESERLEFDNKTFFKI